MPYLLNAAVKHMPSSNNPVMIAYMHITYHIIQYCTHVLNLKVHVHVVCVDVFLACSMRRNATSHGNAKTCQDAHTCAHRSGGPVLPRMSSNREVLEFVGRNL